MVSQKNIDSFEKVASLATSNNSFIFISFKSLNAREMGLLRYKLWTNNSDVMIVKNTILERFFKSHCIEDMCDFDSNTALLYSLDIISLSKVIYEYIKLTNGNVEVLGGVSDYKMLSLSDIKIYSNMPKASELQSMLIKVMRTSYIKLPRVIKSVKLKFIRTLRAIEKKI